MTAEADCMHQALRIEDRTYVCSKCGLVLERKTPEEHIADMRRMLKRGPK